jgi:mRNA-degrading endonuclease RelE of RelBE toxin-antitoxin system
MEHRLVFARETLDHLRRLSMSDRARAIEAIKGQLVHQPTVQTRNRKPLEANPIAPWELRVGRLRVYYDVRVDPEPTVEILAIGVKNRNEVRIGGKVVKL